VMVAAVIGMYFLPPPYYTIGILVIYASLLAMIAAKIRTCWQRTEGSVYQQKVVTVGIWFVLAVLFFVMHLWDLFKTQDHNDYIFPANNFCAYLALLAALELAETFLPNGHKSR